VSEYSSKRELTRLSRLFTNTVVRWMFCNCKNFYWQIDTVGNDSLSVDAVGRVVDPLCRP